MESQVAGLPLAAPPLTALPVPAPPVPALQKIGTVARHSGVAVKTIRFYCDQGLLQPSARSAGGYRLFVESVYGDLALIRMLRALEIPLATSAEVLQARRSGICHCDELRATIGNKAGEIEQRISDLKHLHNELKRMLESWQACGGRRPTDHSVARPRPLPHRSAG
jgi:DNA-binding transcriptional MerR regulator